SGAASKPAEPSAVTPSSASTAAAPATEVAVLLPSAHYLARTPGVDDAVIYDSSILEEYRDDLDPGYRIRELTEAELILELQDKYERALAAAPGLTWGDSTSPSHGRSLASRAADGTAAPGFGGADRPAGSTIAASANRAEDEEPLAATNKEEADVSKLGMMDDELLQSEPEKGKEEESRGSLLPSFVRNAGNAVLAAVGVTASGTAREEHTQESEHCLPADGTLPANSRGPIQGFQGPVDQASAELSETFVPTFGAPAQDSVQPADGAAVSAAVLSPGTQDVLAGFGQAGDGLGYSYAQPHTAQLHTASSEPQQVTVPQALACSRKERRGDRPPCRYADSGDPFYPVELDGVVYDSFNLRVVHERDRTGFEESKEFPIRINSIVAARYQVLEYLGSAAFSRAVQCLDLQTNRMVCMKIIKNNKDFFDQSLDEIKLLRLINTNSDNIDEKHCLTLFDHFYHKEHLIIELLRDNLYEFSKFNRESGEEAYFTLGRLQRISQQVLTALEYIHRLWLIHADLKPENILVKSYSRCEVKVIDFGSSCFVDDQLTNYVQSRSYRAPEVMLGLPYGQKIDIWHSTWTGYVLFQNDSIQSLLARIVGIMGPIPVHMLASGRFVPQYFAQDGRLYGEAEPPPPGSLCSTPVVPQRQLHLYLPKKSSLRQRMRTDDEVFLDFLSSLLQVDPAQRPTASEALQHPWLSPGRYSDGIP
ncbi:unnamed protein product, partial [Polarella glacialis]